MWGPEKDLLKQKQKTGWRPLSGEETLPLESYGTGMYFLEGFGHIGLPAHLAVGLWQRLF